jgi:hypothetical protein
MRINKNGISAVLAVLVVVMLVAVAAAGVYLVTSNTNDDPNDNNNNNIPDEPAIQAKMAAGTVFEYKQVGEGRGPGGPTEYIRIDATIIGQGPQNYIVKVEFERRWIVEDFIVEVNKATGGLRYATKIGTDSIQFGEKTVQLEKWELKLVHETITISVDPQDSIPYKIQYSHSFNALAFSAELSSMKIKEEKGTYVKSDDVGKGMRYSVDRSEYGTGTATFTIVGERTYPASESGRMFCAFVDTRGTKITYYSTLKPEEGVKDIILLSTILYNIEDVETGAIPNTKERISTIDGKVLCDVYKVNPWGNNKHTIHIGQENGVVYAIESENGYKFSLKGYN